MQNLYGSASGHAGYLYRALGANSDPCADSSKVSKPINYST